MSAQPHEPFQLFAAHPILDFVNTLDNRFSESPESRNQERLLTYDHLLRFLVESGLFTENRARKLRRLEATAGERTQILQQAIALREAIAVIGYALVDHESVPTTALASLETFLEQSAAHRRLVAENSLLHWKWSGPSRNLASPLWILAQSAADLFLSGQTSQIRDCASPTCRWLFLDTSKNHTRRWCDMKTCGNRMKARRYHARLATSETVE